MLQFASDLSDDYEYGIVSPGQSNANPRGTLTEGFDAAPSGVRGLRCGPDGFGRRVKLDGGCAAGVGADQWVGAELHMGNASAQSTGYGTVTDCTAASSKVVTFPTNDKATWVAHGLLTGCPVLFAGVAPPTGITLGTIYYVRVDTADTFVLHPTHADAIANTSAVSITANSGTGPFVGYAGSTLTVTWTDTPSTAGRHRRTRLLPRRPSAYQEVRVLTPYLPDQAGAYLSGTPAMPGYTVAATITHENLAAFLPLTFKEGVASFGQCETDEVAASATSSSLTLDSGRPVGQWLRGRLRARPSCWRHKLGQCHRQHRYGLHRGRMGRRRHTKRHCLGVDVGSVAPARQQQPHHLLPVQASPEQRAAANRRRAQRPAQQHHRGLRRQVRRADCLRVAPCPEGRQAHQRHPPLPATRAASCALLSLFGGLTTVGWWSTATHLDWSTSNTDNPRRAASRTSSPLPRLPR